MKSVNDSLKVSAENKALLKEFNKLEIAKKEFKYEINRAYFGYEIEATEKGLYAGAGRACNSGFKPYEGLFIEWDEACSLSEHLECLYKLCYKDAESIYNQN